MDIVNTLTEIQINEIKASGAKAAAAPKKEAAPKAEPAPKAEAPAKVDAPEAASTDLSSMTVAQLKEQCQRKRH